MEHNYVLSPNHNNVITPKHNYVFKQHVRGVPLKSQSKVVVMNVFHKLKEWNPHISNNEIMKKTFELTGVSKISIQRMRKEYEEKGCFSSVGKTRPGRTGLGLRIKKFDDFTLSMIRRKVHSCFKNEEAPTLKKVTKMINEDSYLPNMSMATLRRLVYDMGFINTKKSHNSMLVESNDVQVRRREYLRLIRNFREQGRTIYYTDQTWINIGQANETVSQGNSKVKPPAAGKGLKLIITHAGSVEGFVEGALDLCQGEKTMNSDYYERWFREKLLPNLDSNSVIVCGNASNHSVMKENLVNSNSNREDIRAWLTSRGIIWGEDMLKAELLALVSKVRNRYEACRVDEFAKLCGHTVLRLPPYHCELNPIEHIWTTIKGKVATGIITFKEKAVEQLTREAIEAISPETWKNCVSHVVKEEELMWQIDRLSDIAVERQLNNSDPESTDDDCNPEEVMSS